MIGRTHTTCWIRANYPGRCGRCGQRVRPGDIVLWSSRRRVVTCECCAGPAESRVRTRPVSDRWATAGSAALREYKRRRERRTVRLRRRFGSLGALLSAATGPSHQRAWVRGAYGERLVARRLTASLSGTDVALLHDRRFPSGRANIDHIAIGPAGILVIDAKNLRGAVRRHGRGAQEQLRVGEHDRTTLVISAQRQARALAHVLADHGFDHVPVRAVLCLARPQTLGWRASVTVRGVLVGSPERIARRARRRGGLSPQRVDELAAVLSRKLPPA